jgi:hypothetical protein
MKQGAIIETACDAREQFPKVFIRTPLPLVATSGVRKQAYLHGLGIMLRSLKTVHKSAPPMPRRLWRSSPHPRLRFAIQLASSDPPRIVYLVAVGEIYPG